MKKALLTTVIILSAFFCAAQKVSCPPTMTDFDGNVYNTVLIGDQCWMAGNLNVGTMIDGSVNQSNNGIIEKHCYDNNLSNCNIYGGLYQWNELMQGGAQGICPSGWHIPADGDWQWLATILAGDAGGKMKTTGTIESGTGLWHSPNTGATNSSGFNALPGGRKDENGNFLQQGYNAFFFSSTPWWYCCAYLRQLNYDSPDTYQGWTYLSQSLSVRCLKNEPVAPTVSTSSITGVTATSAVGGGNIIDDGGADVTSRGVVWSTTANPTVENHEGMTTDGTGAGGFTSNLSGLTPETHYFVKAYATNSKGTSYGMEVEFLTIPLLLTVSDLIINAGTDTCFGASQTITVSNCTVKPNGSVNFIAGGNILLQPATKVENGGNLHASITTNQTYCTQNKSMVTQNDDELTKGSKTMVLDEASDLFTLFPNPATSIFTLRMTDFITTQSIHVEIYGLMGEKVMKSDLSGQPQYEFDLTGLPEGVYFIRVIADNEMGVKKLVKQ